MLIFRFLTFAVYILAAARHVLAIASHRASANWVRFGMLRCTYGCGLELDTFRSISIIVLTWRSPSHIIVSATRRRPSRWISSVARPARLLVRMLIWWGLQSIRPKTHIKILFPPQHYMNLKLLIRDSVFDRTNRFLSSDFKND